MNLWSWDVERVVVDVHFILGGSTVVCEAEVFDVAIVCSHLL